MYDYFGGWDEATVEVLINEDTQTWNEVAIDGLFVHEEAALIKKKSRC